jgi:hypothetical protein
MKPIPEEPGLMAFRIVSNTSEEEIRRQQSHKELTRELRRFAANFLRLVSGSGKALDLLGQMERVSDAIREYAEAHNSKLPPQKVIHAILDDHAALREEYRPWIKENEAINKALFEKDGQISIDETAAQIIRAELRMTAANFVDQLTQHSVAETDFYLAANRLEDARTQKRSKHQASPK